MTCSYLPYNEFRSRLQQKLANQRIPITGSIELNFRCNLRCRHCYVAPGHTGIPGKQELSLAEIQRIIDELVQAGCLWLLLTGGEILLRRDFEQIYRYAVQKGLLVTLFTNGTLLTPRLVDLLAEYRPFNLEITLYGRTRETYEKVTGIPGSHARCYRGIDLLLERKIPLRLKTVLMTLNSHELKDMQAYADQHGISFRYDSLINGGIEGCAKPLLVRLPAHQLIQIEQQDPELPGKWRQALTNAANSIDHNQYLYKCMAGISSFHIDPYGQLSICMMARQRTYDLRQGSFQEGWEQFIKQERSLPAPAGPCQACQLQPLCSACPGWSFAEHGDSNAHVDYICQVTHLRAQAFGSPH